jgi:Icc-related predicted phosphoesterase
MKILCLSDTHEFLPNLDLNGIDLVLHCGDITFKAKYSYSAQAKYYREVFYPWWECILDKCPAYFIWGNHDFFASPISSVFAPSEDISLYDEEVIVNGLKIYGTPWQPRFCDWAFNLEDSPDQLGLIYKQIPNDVDILITHCPPWSILDQNDLGEHCGSVELFNRITQLKQLKLMAFGHIHEAYGSLSFNEVQYVNCSIVNEKYSPANKPIIVEL